MPKFIIEWDIGYGPQNEIVEANDKAQAEKMAEAAWREEIEASAAWSAEEYSKERAIECGLEELDEEEDGQPEETTTQKEETTKC